MLRNNGWVKLHRKLTDNELWLSEPFTRGQAWVDLLMLANHKAGFIRRRGIDIKVGRGQIAWGEEALARRWSWSRTKLRRFFLDLAGRSMISRQVAEIIIEQKNRQKNSPKTIQKKTSVSYLFYIENYDRYQGNDTEEHTEETRQNDTEEPFVPLYKEIKRREGRKSPTLAPHDFPITDQMRKYAEGKSYRGNLETLTERFLNHHRAKGSKFASWESAWRNWVLKELEFHPPSPADLPLNGGKSIDEVLNA